MLSFDDDDPSWLFNIGVILFVALCLLVGCFLQKDDYSQNVVTTNLKTNKITHYNNVDYSYNPLTDNFRITTKSGKTIELPGNNYEVEHEDN